MDWQSAFGKVPSGVGLRCRAKGIPAVAIVGGIGDGAEKMYDFGVESIMSTINGAMDLEEALSRAEELYACLLYTSKAGEEKFQQKENAFREMEKQRAADERGCQELQKRLEEICRLREEDGMEKNSEEQTVRADAEDYDTCLLYTS